MPDMAPPHYAELAPQAIFLLLWDSTIFVVTKKFFIYMIYKQDYHVYRHMKILQRKDTVALRDINFK